MVETAFFCLCVCASSIEWSRVDLGRDGSLHLRRNVSLRYFGERYTFFYSFQRWLYHIMDCASTKGGATLVRYLFMHRFMCCVLAGIGRDGHSNMLYSPPPRTSCPTNSSAFADVTANAGPFPFRRFASPGRGEGKAGAEGVGHSEVVSTRKHLAGRPSGPFLAMRLIPNRVVAGRSMVVLFFSLTSMLVRFLIVLRLFLVSLLCRLGDIY